MTEIETRIDFTDKWLKGVKCPPAKAQQAFTDRLSRNGFTLLVSSTGVKSFFGFYRDRNDRKQRVPLGGYPDLTLAQARAKWRKIRSAIADQGADPVADRKAEETALTLADLTASYFEAKAGLRTIDEMRRRLEKNVIPVVGGIKLADLHRRDFSRCLDPMIKRGAGGEANLVHGDCRAMVRWAHGRGDLDNDVLHNVCKPYVKEQRVGDDEEDEEGRVLSDNEIRHLWHALPDAPMSSGIQRILKLQLLTGCRVSEISEMRRNEVDWHARLLRLPKSRVKNKRPHTVPLSDMAIEVLQEQLAEVERLATRMDRLVGDRVFPGKGGRGSINNQAVARAINRSRSVDRDGVEFTMGLPHWTSHALRRSAATLMESSGQSPFVIGHVLNHSWVVRGNVTAKYAKYTYDREKREAINVLAGRIEAIVRDAARIIPLRKKRP